ncbi:unnamed protein product [Coregonus sp. 'balchen']|nr:unnamed protein product [Coregonus sp. 'balchen']
MESWLKNILILAAFCCECRGDSVSQPIGVETATEGGQITLTCHYKADDPGPYLFWYKQRANDYPKYMLMRQKFGTGDNATEFKERFHDDLDANSKSVPLMIQRVQMSDSAVYYCALKPTVTVMVRPAYPGNLILLFMDGAGSTSRAPGLDPRLSVNLNDEKNRVDLKISSAEVTDSALRPTATGNPNTLYNKCTEAGDNNACCTSVEDIITPDSDVVDVMEGSSVKLSYRYNSSVTNSMLWYCQHPGSSPQFLILDYSGMITNTDSTKWTLTHEKEDNHVDLEISSAEVTDSALDYCAQPTVTGNPEKSVSFEDDINPTRSMVGVVEGDSITLSCSYTGSVNNLQWYHQYPRSKPEFLILITKSGYVQKPVPLHLSSQVHTDRVDLDISSAEVTVSALYYCAVKSTLVYLVCVRMSLILLLLLSVFVADSMEQETITPVKPEVNVLQGTDITLSCIYKGNVNYLQWYRQYPGSKPECLLLILQSSIFVQNTSNKTPRHTGRLNEEKTLVDLKITSAELEDPDTLYKNLSINTNNLYLFWYKHEVKFMLGRFSFGSTNVTEFKEIFDAHLNTDSKSDDPEGAAVYYCALKPTDVIGPGDFDDEFKKRFDAHLSSITKSVPLTIQRLQLLCTTGAEHKTM